MKKLIAVAAIAVFGILGLTACGGYDDSDPSETGNSSVFGY